MNRFQIFLVILLLCSINYTASYAQNMHRFKINKIYSSSKVLIGSHSLRVGDSFDFDGVIQWNDSVKCVILDDFKRGKKLTISPYIQKTAANNKISELIYKSSEDTIYIVTPKSPVQLDVQVSNRSKFLFHEKDTNRNVLNDFEIIPLENTLILSYEMFKNRIGLLNCEIVEVTDDGDIKEYPINLLVLETE